MVPAAILTGCQLMPVKLPLLNLLCKTHFEIILNVLNWDNSPGRCVRYQCGSAVSLKQDRRVVISVNVNCDDLVLLTGLIM